MDERTVKDQAPWCLKIMLYSITCALWLIAGDWVAVSHAEQNGLSIWVFELVEGQGTALCEACVKALQHYPSDPTGCERQYKDELGFAAPKWTDLDVLKHMALVKQLMLLLIPTPKEAIEGTIFDGPNFSKEVRQLLMGEAMALSVTNVDIDNDGKGEPVAKFRTGICGNRHDVTFDQMLVVLTPDLKGIDLTKTDLVTQNPNKRPEWPAGFAQGRIYDVFRYRGRVFFDQWDNDVSEHEIFTVYQAAANRTTPLCKYRYDRYKQRPSGSTK